MATNPNKIIHIRSIDCLLLNDVYSVSIPEAISVASDEELTIEVLNASIPYSFFNVNFSNKFLSIIEAELNGSNPVSWDLELPEGNYNSITFLSMFQTTINAQSISLGKSYNYSLSYNKTTNTATILLNSANAQTNFLFLTGNIARFDCQLLLGFSLADFQFVSNIPLVGDNSMNMSPYDAIYIYSNLGITNSYDTKSRNLTNILVKIPITSLPFSYIQWENQQFLTYKSTKNTISNLEFRIADYDGDPIQLRGALWFLSIKFTISKKDKVFQVPRPNEQVPVEF
jgi:hypothetical protein